ncbi:MAG: lipoate-protein ligase B [Rhodospirillaceae bacterium]|nr:lipoate-protein ligase B [Rhodospirillaceae bacterium]
MEDNTKAKSNDVEWKLSDQPVPYADALLQMESRVAKIREGAAPELVWLLEHPPLITAGTSADADDLLDKARFPVFETGRGGQYTYHGPGQRVAYVMLDLKRRGPDLRQFVHNLEEWIIQSLARFNVIGERREDRIGIWVAQPGGREDKVAAIGVRIRKWVSYHGIAINVEPDLGHYDTIRPCGIDPAQFGVTSLVALGLPVTMEDLDVALMECFGNVFG